MCQDCYDSIDKLRVDLCLIRDSIINCIDNANTILSNIDDKSKPTVAYLRSKASLEHEFNEACDNEQDICNDSINSLQSAYDDDLDKLKEQYNIKD